MGRVLALSTVHCELVPQSCQPKHLTNWYLHFSAKHAPLKSKNKDWLAQNQDNVSKWNDMSTSFQ